MTIDECPASLYNIKKKLIEEEEEEGVSIDEYEKKIEVYYIWGESGCGKTTLAKKMIRDKDFKKFHPVKHVGEFW